jgi:O-antigen ligase
MAFLDSLRNHPLGIQLKQLAPSRLWEERPNLFSSLCAFTLVSSLLLGGGTRGGFLSDTILELFAIPAFLFSLSSLVALPWTKSKRSAEWALMLCLAIAIVPLLQLIPLPPWIWTRLPNRGEMAGVFGLVGRELPWFPVSVAPTATWLSVLSLLPPLAIFLAVIQLSYRERRMLSLILLGVGILGAFVGLLQVAQGPSSPLRFFAFTNQNEAVGFFANRNHFASLIYVLLLNAAAWATDVAFTSGSWTDRRNLQTKSIATLTASLLVLVILIAAEGISRSRAGLGLTIVAIFGMFALSLTDRRRAAGVTPVKLMMGSTIVAIVLGVQFVLYRILDRFYDPLQDARGAIARNTIAAADAYMPFGSGVGTFTSAYPTFEPPQDAIANIYVNHAHNDFLELTLENGAVGVVLVAVFAVWFVMGAAKIWRPPTENIRAVDVLLARAATIAIALIIAHCFFDYPLRTGAMMAVFAFSCALLIEPLNAAPNEVPARSTIATVRDEEVWREAAPHVPMDLDNPFETPDESTALGNASQNVARIGSKVATGLPADVMHSFANFDRLPGLSSLSSPKEMPRAPEPQVPAVSDTPTPEIPAQPPQELWGEDIEWPDQWRNSRAPNGMRDGPIIATEGVKETALRLAASQGPRALGKRAGAPASPVEPGRWGNEVDWPGQWQNIPAPGEMTVRPNIATAESEEATSRPAAPRRPADLDTLSGGREKPEQPDPAPSEMTVEPDIATAGSGEETLGVAAPQVPMTSDTLTGVPEKFAQPDSAPSDGTVEVDIATERSAERIPRASAPQLPAASVAPADKPEKVAKQAWEQWVQSPDMPGTRED